ncbi:MAG TPA: multiheme c-type cytochrome [Polyangiaceae bacterium]|nr:multiheme c-type cytochrome [Polyangiaceae bacterium]
MPNELSLRRALGSSLLLLGMGVSSMAACDGCRPKQSSTGSPADLGPPSVRFYLTSDVAGALEPCGCVRDQLGGLDHVAAFMKAEQRKTPDSVFLSAGPLFFLDPVIKEERKGQELAKAETLAESLRSLDLVAFSPGRNDWAMGPASLADLVKRSGAASLVANEQPLSAPFVASVLRDVHGVKVGLVGVAAPNEFEERGEPLGSLVFEAPEAAVKREAAELRRRGAQIVVALAATGRGEAKRLADTVPDLTAVLVGSTGSGGDANTETPSPELVGKVLIVETGNHLQTVGVLDLFVRDQSYDFSDGTGLAQNQKRKELDGRIQELRTKIEGWEKAVRMNEKGGRISQSDLDARKHDLARLEAQRQALDATPPPRVGSFFRYTVTEVRDTLGADPTVRQQLLAYYKKVNEANQVAFRDRLPPPPGPDGNAYAGVAACVPCHENPKKVWDGTAHAHAYKTLADGFKQFNLDCVSCHVTGYEQPGGSSVTHVEKLQDVQCESCHGPSSKHVANPKVVHVPVPTPGSDLCKSCHHPPHVHVFDAAAKIPEILGPGHGLPMPPKPPQ